MSIFKNNSGVIQYSINKEFGSNCYIAVDSGEVVVNAPWYFSRKQIQSIIEEKRNWIIEKLKEYQEKNNAYTDKGSISILGVTHKICLYYKNIKTPTINLVNHSIEIFFPNKYKKMDTAQILNILIEKLYAKIAEQEIEQIMEKVRLMVGFAPENYFIKKIENNMLGTCITEKQEIIISPDIVKCDRKTIEYIVLHQFCHLKYKIHSKGFWQMIEKYMPEYKRYTVL